MELILAIGYLLIGGLAIYAFSRIHLLFWRAYHHTDTCPDAIHFAQTDDGWRVALHRYRRPERATRAAPVLLCPGMMVNRRLMDLTPDRSLARTLSDVGFDVWVLEVRGVGASTRPSWLHNRTWEITFEDFVDRDAPAAIGLIRAQTGADRVHWMGHGLGGMIGAAVAQQPTSKLASLALIGSSGRPKLPAGVRFGVSMAWMLSWLPSASTKALSAFLAPFYIPTPLDAVLVRSENLAPEAARVALAHMAEDLPMPLLRQCSRWAMVGEMVSSRDDRNFTQALDQIQVPLLGVAADDDRLATPSAVRYAVERAASTRKAYINIGGEGAGARLTPCGHLDMLIGDAAARDVFPRLAGWLAQVEGLELEALAQLSRQDDTSQPTPAAKPSTPVVAEDKTETPSTVVFPEPSVVPMVARGGGDQEGEMADDDLLSAPLENSSSVSQEAPLFMEVRADVPPTDSTEPREHNAHEDDAAPKADDEEEPWASSAVPLAEALQAPPVLGGQEAQPQLPTDEGLVVAVPGLSPSRDEGMLVADHLPGLERVLALDVSDGALEDLEAAPLPGYDMGGSVESPQARLGPSTVPVFAPEGLDEGLDEGWEEGWDEDVQALLIAPRPDTLRRSPSRHRHRSRSVAGRLGSDEGEDPGGRPRPARLHRSPVSGGDLYEALKDAAARADRALTRPGVVPSWASRFKRAERPPKTVGEAASEPPDDAEWVE